MLNLAANTTGDEGAIALGRNSEWNHFLSLALFENEIGWKGAIALDSNSTWSKNNKNDLADQIFLRGRIANCSRLQCEDQSN